MANIKNTQNKGPLIYTAKWIKNTMKNLFAKL